MSFDVTNPNGQPKTNAAEWIFCNHALNPKGKEFSYLPPIQGSVSEDSNGESSNNGDSLAFCDEQSGNGQRLPSIKLLDLQHPNLHNSQFTVPYIPINLEGVQPPPTHMMQNTPPLQNSPSCLNLSLWSLNSPSSYPNYQSLTGNLSNMGPDSLSVCGAQIVNRQSGPSHTSYFRPIPTVGSTNNTVYNYGTNSYTGTPGQFQVNSPFIESVNFSKRKSSDALDQIDPTNALLSNSRTKRYSFSTYSPQIQTKKVHTSGVDTSKRALSSTDEEENLVQRRSSFKEIPIQSIVQHLHLSQRDAAKSLGVSVSTLKRRFYSVRDQIGIEKWPTLSTTTIQNSQQSLSSVLVKYPIVNQTTSIGYSHQISPNQGQIPQKEEDSCSSSNGISSSASCAPLQ